MSLQMKNLFIERITYVYMFISGFCVPRVGNLWVSPFFRDLGDTLPITILLSERFPNLSDTDQRLHQGAK